MARSDDKADATPKGSTRQRDARVSDAAQGKGSRGNASPRAAPVNAIQATRRHRKGKRSETPIPQSPKVLGEPARPENTTRSSVDRKVAPDPADRADSDPWTVPESIRDRFVQDGNRFFFPDGAPAFRDLGRRLTTPSENTQVVHSLIQIAHSRGWSEVTVSGTERFRQEAWRQARMAGLAVRGYRPTDVEQAQLIRGMARTRPLSATRDDSVSVDAQPGKPRAPLASPPAAAVADRPGDAPAQRIAGKLLEHGRDAYRHDPKEEMSYFVSVQTREGRREIWGKDLERAMTKSLTQPQIGDDVVLQKNGRDAVTVKRQERDGDGQLKEKAVETHRNRWVIEKSAFFSQREHAAQVIRDTSIDAHTAVREHPELAGTYLNLKAAELAARALRDAEDRRRFLAQVRIALADDIERGEPMQPVRLRERAPRRLQEGSVRPESVASWRGHGSTRAL
jgi:Large polyvalent protein-associated domain 7